MSKTIPRGIHPRGYKELTDSLPITVMPAPSRVYILTEARGRDPEVFVKVGDEVSAGTLLAKGRANVYASCSGVVSEIALRHNMLNKKRTHIIIENDGRGKTVGLPPLENPSSDEIIERIITAGIVGMGGAGFPAGDKLKTNKKIDVFLINGAECEPYINCDNRIMIEHPLEAVEGARLLKTAANASRVVIALEDNKPEAIARLSEVAARFDDVEICPLKTKYPQGDARRLIHSTLGIKIPQARRTTDFGVMVNNVQTAYTVYQAVKKGIPSYSRVITVSGLGIKKPGNYLVANGTLFSDLIEFAGGMDEENTVKLICGGPMMGVSLLNPKYPTSNTSGSLLLLTAEETNLQQSSPCINCAKCAKVCPVHIMPMYIDLYTRVHDFESAKRYGVESCIECGCCAYVCPAKRLLVTSMKQAKKHLAAKKKEAAK